MSLTACFKKGKVPQEIRDEIARYGDDAAAVEAYLADIRAGITSLADDIGVTLPAAAIERSADLRIAFASDQELGDTYASRRSFFQENYTPDSLESFIASQPAMFHVELQQTAEAERAAQAGRGVTDEDAVLRQVQFMAEILRTKAIKNGQTFAQNEAAGPKGMIEMVGDEYIISLFPGANASTLLHETGHLFLEEMRTVIKTGLASEQTQQDWATISEYLGNDGTAITRAQHERWARSFEAYLREGKAPSTELEGPFSLFRTWLTRIYSSVKQLLLGGVTGDLTPEVRLVMDRMLATQEQIEQLAIVNGMRASLGTVTNVPTVDEGRRSRLQQLIDNGARQMADALWKKRTRQTREQIKTWRREIRDAINGEQVYQAWSDIRNGGGLNPIRIEAEYGADTVGLLRKKGLLAVQRGKNAPLEDAGKSDGVDASFDVFAFEQQDEQADFFLPATLKSRRGIPYAPNDIPTILNVIDDLGGIKPANGAPEYDDKPSIGGVFARITVKDGGVFPDQMASMLEDEGIGDGSVSTMWQMVADDLMTRESLKARVTTTEPAQGIGLSPEVVAVRNGYDDGTAMMLDLLGADRPAVEAKARLARKVESADATVPPAEALLDSPDLQQAIDAMGQYYAESLAGGGTYAKRQAIRDRAEDAFWQMPVREATRIDQFLGTAQRHLAAERKAVARNDFEAALAANTEARMQIMMAGLSRKLREDEQKHARMIRRLARSKQGDLEEQHHKNLLALIDRYKLAPVPMRNGRPIVDYTTGKEPLEKVLRGEIDELGMMSVADQFDPALRDESNSGNYRDMDANAYNQLILMARFLNDRGRAMVRDWIADAKINAAEGVERMIAKSAHIKPVNRQTENRIFGGLLANMRKFGSSLKQMPFVFRTMDGIAPGQDKTGPYFDLIVKPLVEAEHTNELMMRDLREKLREPMEVFARFRARMGAFPTTTVPVPEAYAAKYGAAWTTEQIMAVALNMGSQYNIDSVAAGMGLKAEDGTIDTAPLFELVSILGKTEWDAVQQMWDTIDSLWPQLAEQHRRLYYYTPPKVRADEVSIRTNSGETVTLKGGYYPLKFDASLSDVQAGQEEIQDLLNTSAAATGPISAQKGFTKSRQGISGKPVLLSTSVAMSHVQYVTRFITHAKTVQDINRMLSKQAMRDEIKRVWGDEVAQQIPNWLRANLATETEAIDGLGRIVNGLRPYVTSFYLFGNVRTSILQVAAAGDLVAEVGPVRYARGMIEVAKAVAKGPLDFVRWMDSVSPFMESRRSSREREVEETRKRMGMTISANRFFNLPGVDVTARGIQAAQQAATEFFAYMLAFPAWLVEVPAWLSIYNEQVEANGGDAKAAAAMADERIARSRPSLRKMDMAQMQRSKQGAHTLMTFFSSFAFTYGNRNGAAYRAMRNGDMTKLEYAKYVGIQAVIVPAMTALGFALLWGRDIEDEEDRDQTAKEMMIEVLTYQFQGIPVVNQASRYIVNQQAGEFAGDPWRSPAFSVADKSVRLANNLLNYANDLDNPDARDDALWSLYEMASIVSKVPASQIQKRLGEGLRQVTDEDASWPSFFIPDPEKRQR